MPQFINPPTFGAVGEYKTDQIYTVGSTLNFSWTGTVEDSKGNNLWLKKDIDGYTCEPLNLAKTACWMILENNNATSFDWVVDVPSFDGLTYDSNSPVYYVHMYDSTNSRNLFGAHYFNIVASSESVSGSSTSPASTPTSSSPTTLPNNTDTNTSTRLALGIGLGIGIPLILVLSVIAWLLYRRNNRERSRGIASTAPRESFVNPPTYKQSVSGRSSKLEELSVELTGLH